MLQTIKNFKTNNKTSRLDWDEYFMSIALLASHRSPCQRLNVGSVIVKNNRLISMGYIESNKNLRTLVNLTPFVQLLWSARRRELIGI